jgi:cytochrome c oxidase assembly factor CtaG
MDYLTQHWSFGPYVVVALVVAAAHEVGLRRLGRRSLPTHQSVRRRRSLVFYAGLVLLVIGVDSPIEFWSFRYFYVHMFGHVLVSFFVAILVVLGAPWVPLLHSLPVVVRRRAGRALLLGRWSGGIRAVGRFVTDPWTALLSFNAAMVLWHLPGPFDLAQANGVVHTWLMYGSLLVTGILFWLQILPSHPFRPRSGAAWQIGAIISTNVVMFVLAMSMSILTSSSWYGVYAHVPGVSLSPFADQQIGAAILWVCGDFWAIPSLVYVIKRAVDEQGSLAEVVESLLNRAPAAGLDGLWSPTALGGWAQRDGGDGTSAGGR